MTDINGWMVFALAAVPAAGLAGAAFSAALISRKQKRKEKKKESTYAQMHLTAEGFPKLSGDRLQETGGYGETDALRAGAYRGTGVLGAECGETSVFGAGFSGPSAILIRRKTGTRADIKRPLFLIGKDSRRTDLHMEGNDAVSRIHAGIVCKDGRYYLIDRNSTNGTWLNGRKLKAGEEALLEPGDRIRLADEELDFWL